MVTDGENVEETHFRLSVITEHSEARPFFREVTFPAKGSCAPVTFELAGPPRSQRVVVQAHQLTILRQSLVFDLVVEQENARRPARSRKSVR